MKIGLDARLYGLKSAGIGRYLQNLLENLEEIDKENQYVIFLRRENWDEYRPRNPNFRKALADCRPYSLKEQLMMPFLIRREKVGLMHFPHFNVPVFHSGKFVVTIHDLIPLYFSGQETSTLNKPFYSVKKAAMKMVMAAAIKKSEKIIAVSEYTKKDILENFKVLSEKIEVVYEGAPEIKVKSEKLKVKSTIQNSKVLNFKIEKPYLLYIGSAYPHKNLERLLEAFKKLITDNLQLKTYKLILVGKEDYFYQKVKRKAMESGIGSRVIFTGFVSDEDLPALYQNAALYVFPSLFEGFGLPPLEAMSYGLPVASSNATCLPEILGDAAEYFNPTDIDEMAKAIRGIIGDEDRQKELAERGQERIQNFSWQKCAEKTLKVYQKS